MTKSSFLGGIFGLLLAVISFNVVTISAFLVAGVALFGGILTIAKILPVEIFAIIQVIAILFLVLGIVGTVKGLKTVFENSNGLFLTIIGLAGAAFVIKGISTAVAITATTAGVGLVVVGMFLLIEILFGIALMSHGFKIKELKIVQKPVENAIKTSSNAIKHIPLIGG